MKKEEIQELMDLMGWSRTRLAAELDLTENTVHRWFMVEGGRVPGGPASILMRMWLDNARATHAGREAATVPQPRIGRHRKDRQPVSA